MLIMGRSVEVKVTGKSWSEMITILGTYKPRLYYYIVKWKPPDVGQVKCNTNGASKGNPGETAYGFCLGTGMGTYFMLKLKE
ncbi:hypothetical protein R3W88_007690 [Solanum pinnatisectum]|uniref:Uncharacterized protein n=1 Tax=Solanum pinnatisectum TaxID=50273 RepID=A0AAV9M933_9SOLN|nr:hypothetical protein R3W88_007690 [Solanum pinnatisectum]